MAVSFLEHQTHLIFKLTLLIEKKKIKKTLKVNDRNNYIYSNYK